MNDLISRKVLIKAMEKKYDVAKETGMYPTGLSEAFIITEKIIKKLPTVYDVDKVVEKLKNLSQCLCAYKPCKRQEEEISCEQCFIKKAIEIVKGGGKDE